MNSQCGIFPGLSRQEYDAIPGVNQSVLKHMRRSPAHVLERKMHPPTETDAMRLGTMAHLAILEPRRLQAEYVVVPDLTIGIQTKDGKPAKAPKATEEYKTRLAAFAKLHEGKQFVHAEELYTANEIAEAIAANQQAATILDGAGDNEVAVVWQDPETGLLCKALLDRLTPTDVIDLKTMGDASLPAIKRTATRDEWHLQACFYLWGLATLGESRREFRHICCEVAGPYGVNVVRLGDRSLERGSVLIRSYLTQYAECQRVGHWPNYPGVTTDIDVLPWELREED